MKKILFITAFVPSRIGAGENTSRQLINDLAKHNKIDLIFFKYQYNDDYVIESQNVTILKVFKNTMILKVLNFLMFPFLFPLFVVRFNFFRLFYIKRIIRQNNYDLMIFDFSQTFLFAKFIRSDCKLLFSQDVIAQRYSRIVNGILFPIVKISEGFVLRGTAIKIFTPSEKDSKLIMELYLIETESTDFYLEDQIIQSGQVSVGDYFVMFANWSRSDNLNGLIWFLRNVFPDLKADFKLKVIGAGLTASAEAQAFIQGSTNIEYLGFVQNPYPLISEARALIAPLFRGAGVKVKVIESLGCGTPVIGTEITFEGVPERYSSFMKMAKTSNDFINLINGFNINMSDKIEFKKYFIETYNNKRITGYINSI